MYQANIIAYFEINTLLFCRIPHFQGKVKHFFCFRPMSANFYRILTNGAFSNIKNLRIKGINTAGQALHPPPAAVFRGKPRGIKHREPLVRRFLTRSIMSVRQ